MNKKELAEEWGKRTNAESKAAATRAVDAFINIIRDTLAKDEEVRLGGLGVLTVVDKAAREARNPNNNATIHVPAKKVVKFRPAKDLTEAINQ
ncbi:HU family DNA-binding protein (plasmid) [Microtetraspora malaysiensis]|uniref:HU family DNA-binding protein n=1 Tax=Microtetraspora malaysiensis TaxID=161358 RepID=UPI003D8DA98E